MVFLNTRLEKGSNYGIGLPREEPSKNSIPSISSIAWKLRYEAITRKPGRGISGSWCNQKRLLFRTNPPGTGICQPAIAQPMIDFPRMPIKSLKSI
jgi:hypothetical protein